MRAPDRNLLDSSVSESQISDYDFIRRPKV